MKGKLEPGSTLLLTIRFYLNIHAVPTVKVKKKKRKNRPSKRLLKPCGMNPGYLSSGPGVVQRFRATDSTIITRWKQFSPRGGTVGANQPPSCGRTIQPPPASPRCPHMNPRCQASSSSSLIITDSFVWKHWKPALQLHENHWLKGWREKIKHIYSTLILMFRAQMHKGSH